MLDQRVANNMDARSDSDIDIGPNIVVNNSNSSRQQQQQHHSRRRQQRHSATSGTNSNVNRPSSQSSNYSNSISRTSSTSSLHRGDDSEASTPTTASEDELDAEHEELVRLRCQSICTEVIADRHKRKNRCADYPGLAFGTSIFSSNTLMKFSIIKNELHNITNVQLKRAESEVAALNRRIQLLEEDLERSEERLKIATQKLGDATHSADESERIRKALENRTNMEDDRVSILEAQLAQAKMIAEEADKKYEECVRLI